MLFSPSPSLENEMRKEKNYLNLYCLMDFKDKTALVWRDLNNIPYLYEA